MKRHLFGTFGALAAVLLFVGCVSDPTADLRGDIDQVFFTRSYVQLDVGGELQMEAYAVDRQGNIVGTLPAVQSSNTAVATIEIDTAVSGDPLPRTRFVVTAVGAGSAELTATAGGKTSDPAVVISFPLEFDGSITVDQTGYMDVLTVTATEFITFDPDNSMVTLDGGQTYLLSRTAGQIVVQSLSNAALTGATVTISDLLFLGSSEIAELDAMTTVSVRAEPNEPANDVPATAPATAPGDPDFVGSLGDGGFDGDDWFVLTLAASATVTITVGFPENTDVDLNLYDATLTRIDYSWYDNPEVVSPTLAAGTYYVRVRLYATDDPDPIYYTYSITSP